MQGPSAGSIADDAALRVELMGRLRDDPALDGRLFGSPLVGVWYEDLEVPGRVWRSPQLRGLAALSPAADPSGARDGAVVRLPRADGVPVEAACRTVVLRDGEGRPVRRLVVLEDRSSRAAEARLSRVAADQSAIFAASGHGIVLIRAIHDGAGRACDFLYEEANPAACTILKVPREELLGRRMGEVFPGTFETPVFENFRWALEAGEPVDFELHYLHEAFDHWFKVTAHPTTNDRLAVTFGDVTDLKRAIDRLGEQEALLRDLLETVPDAVAAYDAQDRLAFHNTAYLEHFGHSRHAIRIGATFESILRAGLANGQYPDAGDTPDSREAWLAWRLEAHCNPGPSITMRLPGGRWLQVRERRSRNGYIVGVRSDVTKLKAAEAQLKRHAERDVLTGLANRAVLFERLDALAGAAVAGEGSVGGALLLFDMDHFKEINDTLGHDVGDAVLRAVAERLSAATPAIEVVARLGGDEFAAIATGAEGHAALVEAVQAKVSAPMDVAGRRIAPNFSIGVALFPADGEDARTLFKNADIALYESKRRGRGRWSFFDPAIRARYDRRSAIVDGLRHAIAGDEFFIVLQPQIAIADGRHRGFEALVRWGTGAEAIAPREFVPIAEETGLMGPLGTAILSKALAFARSLLDRGLDPGTIAVNLSKAQLKSAEFAGTVADLLARHRLEPWRLEFEVTEAVLLDRSLARIEGSLRALHTLGVSMALDDFGTGYASLTNLRRLPVNRIKIDQSFVRDIGSDPDDAAIVRTIIQLGHSLGMDVVAEGIETEDQWRFLRINGCDFAQGFHLGRPMTPAQSLRYLRRKGDAGRGFGDDLIGRSVRRLVASA